MIARSSASTIDAYEKVIRYVKLEFYRLHGDNKFHLDSVRVWIDGIIFDVSEDGKRVKGLSIPSMLMEPIDMEKITNVVREWSPK